MGDSAPAVAMAPLQQAFQTRWPTLGNPHVRALAWLLWAPDLLDADAPRWTGRIARLPELAAAIDDWLLQLDAAPQALEAFLGVHRYTRLGRYAENLLDWYFRHRGVLHAHGVQVRNGKEDTVGEFDFLLNLDAGLTHWELATKFYLLCSDDPALQGVQQADYFVGPNLADTLGRKMRKILDRQLALGSHPAAAALLPGPLAAAQALVKGWLFYRRQDAAPGSDTGISAMHCRGWWCALSELDHHVGQQVALLSRLEWLAPVSLPADRVRTREQATATLAKVFAGDGMPVMAVSLVQQGERWVEADRGFVVPDQWQLEALRKMALA